jgi:glycosyltransferase involved in cell wall biosynthesis
MSARTAVHVIHDLRFGGTERRLLRLLGAIDPARYRSLLVCIDGLGELAAEAAVLGLDPIVIGRSRRWDVSGIGRLARLARREGALVVHGWLFMANAYARLGGRLGGVPVVIAAEGGLVLTMNERRARAMRTVERTLAPLTDGYVANSRATADGLRGLGAPGGKIAIVHNGVPLAEPLADQDRHAIRESLGLPANATLVTMVARLDAEFKDHETFLRTVAALPSVVAAVVGDGPDRAAVEDAARRLGIDGRVVFTGFRPDAARIAATADVSVLLSYSEGFSNVVLESMAAGVPVVATDIAANREAIRDGVDGLLVPVGDVDATVAAVRGLLDDRARASRLGAAARERIGADFSVAAQAEQTMALYDRLLARKRG